MCAPSALVIVDSGSDMHPLMLRPFGIALSELVSLRIDVASVAGEQVTLVGLVACDCHSCDDGSEPFSDECRCACRDDG